MFKSNVRDVEISSELQAFPRRVPLQKCYHSAAVVFVMAGCPYLSAGVVLVMAGSAYLSAGVVLVVGEGA